MQHFKTWLKYMLKWPGWNCNASSFLLYVYPTFLHYHGLGLNGIIFIVFFNEMCYHSRYKLVYSLLFFLEFMSPFSLRLLLGKPLTCVQLVCQMMTFTLSDIHIRQSHHHIALCLQFPMVNICVVILQMVLPTFLTLATLHFTVYLPFSTSTRTYLPLYLVHWKSV